MVLQMYIECPVSNRLSVKWVVIGRLTRCLMIVPSLVPSHVVDSCNMLDRNNGHGS